jgi:hypothetical protein
MVQRVFGWIQDSGSFSNLKNILRALDNSTEIVKRIKKYVPERYGRDTLLEALTKEEVDYNLMKGKGASCQLTVEENMTMFGYSKDEAQKLVAKGGRGNASASGVAQLCLVGQKIMPDGSKKPYQGDWQAECFLRWGVTLGFLDYSYERDTVKLSELGRLFVETKDESSEEKEIIGSALLTYPPACRVLELIAKKKHLTKFEIGSQLGFTGEDGFTSIPQNLYVSGLGSATSPAERKNILQNVEGSADKYARMIAGWLIYVGYLTQVDKLVTIEYAGIEYSEKLSQSYMITLKGQTQLKKVLGDSSVKQSKKRVFKDMLATKALDKDYLKTRRSYILEILGTEKNLETIQAYLSSKGMNESKVTISDDLANFGNIGLHIKQNGDKYRLLDNIELIGITSKKPVVKSNSLIVKDELRLKLKSINHKYLILLDLSYSSDLNRDFEIETMSLLTEELRYNGTHLGGASKPDGVAFRGEQGIIVDTKAYSKGYSLPIKQADEMIRYIEENKTRGEINPNKWWENFDVNVKDFSYLFVSSEFTGGFQDRINYIKKRTDYDGGVITAKNLLLFAEEVASERLDYSKSFKVLKQNSEIIMG